MEWIQNENNGILSWFVLKRKYFILATCTWTISKIESWILQIRSYDYFSSPGLSWDPMLKMTVVKLDYISDNDTYQFIEIDMRREESYIAQR